MPNDYDYTHDFSRRGMASAPAPMTHHERLREEILREARWERVRAQQDREVAQEMMAAKVRPPPGPSRDERRAYGLYEIADRNFADFLAMLDEPKSTSAAIEALRGLCAVDREVGTDDEASLKLAILQALNEWTREDLKERPQTVYDHLMGDED